MTNIIIINGPCGIGKSTISQALHDKIPGSFLWKKDKQRRNISGYKSSKEDYKASAKSILCLSQSIIQGSITNNNDFIFDGLLRIPEQIEALRRTTTQNRGIFYHFILNAPRKFWQARIQERGVGGSLTFEKAEDFYDEIQKLQTLNAHIPINVTGKSIDLIVTEILQKIYT